MRTLAALPWLWKTLKYWCIVDLHIPHRDNDTLGA